MCSLVFLYLPREVLPREVLPDEPYFFPNYFSIPSVFVTFAFRIKQEMLIFRIKQATLI